MALVFEGSVVHLGDSSRFRDIREEKGVREKNGQMVIGVV